MNLGTSLKFPNLFVTKFTFILLLHTLYGGDFMGLSSSSTGRKLLNDDIEILKDKCDYTIAIARKS